MGERFQDGMAICASRTKRVNCRSECGVRTRKEVRPGQGLPGDLNVGVCEIYSWVKSVEMHLGRDLLVLKTQNDFDDSYQSRSSFTVANVTLDRTNNYGVLAVGFLHGQNFQWITGWSTCTLYSISICRLETFQTA